MLRVRKKKKSARSDELLKVPTTVTACSDSDISDGGNDEKVTMSVPPLRSLAIPPPTIVPAGRQGGSGGGLVSSMTSGDSAGRAISQQHLHLQSGSGSQSITPTGISSRTPSYGIPTFDAIPTTRTQFDSPSGSSSDGSGSDLDSEGGGGSSARRQPLRVFPQQDFKYEALVDGVLRDRALIDGSNKRDSKATRAGGPGGIVVQFPEIQSNIASDGQPTSSAYSTSNATHLSPVKGGESAIVPLTHPLTFVSREGVAPDGSKTIQIEKVMFVTQRERKRLIKDAAGLRARRRRGDRADAQKGGGVVKANRLLYVPPPTDGESSSSGRSSSSSSSMNALDEVDEAGALVEVQRALTVENRGRPHERVSHVNNLDNAHSLGGDIGGAPRKTITKKQEDKNARIQERLAVTLLDPERNNRNQALRKDLHRLRVVSSRDVERHVATERHKQRLSERNLRQSLRETIAQSNHGLVQARVSGKTQIFADKEKEWRQQREANKTSGTVFDGMLTGGSGLEMSLGLEQSGSQYTSQHPPHMQLGQALPPISSNTIDRSDSPVVVGGPIGRKARSTNNTATTSFFFTQQPEDDNSEDEEEPAVVPDPELTTTLPAISSINQRSPLVKNKKRDARHLTGPADRSVAVRNPLLSYTERNLSIWSEANARRKSEMSQSHRSHHTNNSVIKSDVGDTSTHNNSLRRHTATEMSSSQLPLPPNRSSFGSKVVPPPRLLPGLSGQKSIHSGSSVDGGGGQQMRQEATSSDVNSSWPVFEKITDSNNESPFSSSPPPPPFRSVKVVGSIQQKVLALQESRKKNRNENSTTQRDPLPLEDITPSSPNKVAVHISDMSVTTPSNILSSEEAQVVRTPSGTTSNVSGFSASPEPTPIQPARRKSAHALTAFLPVLAAAMMLKKRRMSLSSQRRESSAPELPDASDCDDARSPSPVLHNRARRETAAAPSPDISDLRHPSSMYLKAELSKSHLGLLSGKAHSLRSASSRSALEQSEARQEAEALAQRQAEEHLMRDMARRFQPIYATDIFSREKITLFDKALATMDRQKRRSDQRKNKRRKNSTAGGFSSAMLLPIVARRLSAGLPSPFQKKHTSHLSLATSTHHTTTTIDNTTHIDDTDSRSDVSGDSRNEGGATSERHSSRIHHNTSKQHHQPTGCAHIPPLLPNPRDLDDGVASMVSEGDNSMSVASGAVTPSHGHHSTSTPTHGGSTPTRGGSYYTTKGSDSCISIPNGVPLSHRINNTSNTSFQQKGNLTASINTTTQKKNVVKKRNISGCHTDENYQRLAAEARERIKSFKSRRDAAVSDSADALQEEFRVAHIQRLQAAIRGAHDSKHRLETMHKALHRQEALRPLQGEKRRDALQGTGFTTSPTTTRDTGGVASTLPFSSSVRPELSRPKHPSEILETVAKEAAHDFAEVGRLESHVARLEAVRPVLQYLKSTFLHPAAQEICRKAEELVADEALFVSPEEERQAQRRVGEDVSVAVTSTGPDSAAAATSQPSLRPPTITVAKSAEPPRDPVEATVALINSLALSQRSKTNKGVFLEKLVPIAEPHDLLSDDTLSVLTYCGMIFSASPAEVATVALQRAYALVADHGAILESKVRGLTTTTTSM